MTTKNWINNLNMPLALTIAGLFGLRKSIKLENDSIMRSNVRRFLRTNKLTERHIKIQQARIAAGYEPYRLDQLKIFK